MATNGNNSKNMVDLMVENQTKLVDQAVEATKKLTKDIPFVNETLDKGNNLFKTNLQNQASFIAKTTETITDSSNEMNKNTEFAKNYFEQWFDNQTNWAKNMFSTNPISSNGFSANPTEWMNTWQNWMSQAQSNIQTNPWNQMMNQNHFMNFQGKMNDGVHQWGQYVKQYMDLMNSGNGDWWKGISNITAADSYKGMNHMADSLNKFYEMWLPMFKSIQEKNFNLDVFKQNLSPEKYKEFIDKFFSFMPEDSRKAFDQMNHNFVSYMKQMSEAGLKNYQGFKTGLNSNPFANTNPFNQMMDMYVNWRNAMSEAVSPLSKLVEENSNVKNAKVWNEIYDQMMQFNIKNNELQYMMYQHGMKVMEDVAVGVAQKIEKGESFDSIVKVYQDWLMKGDEKFSSLFNSDEYSKLMTEVSSLQSKIKMEIDKQMEKMFFVNLPVATRTEMDEVYKNIYDLKKMYRNLERTMGAEQTEEAKPVSKKK